MATHSHGSRQAKGLKRGVVSTEDDDIHVEVRGGRVYGGGKPASCAGCGHNPFNGKVTGDEPGKPNPVMAKDNTFGCAHCGKEHTVKPHDEEGDAKLQAWAASRRNG